MHDDIFPTSHHCVVLHFLIFVFFRVNFILVPFPTHRQQVPLFKAGLPEMNLGYLDLCQPGWDTEYKFSYDTLDPIHRTQSEHFTTPSNRKSVSKLVSVNEPLR